MPSDLGNGSGMITAVSRSTEDGQDGLFVLESCHSTWIFDTERLRFRRILKGLALDAHAATTQLAAVLRVGDRPDLRVVRRALEPRGQPPPALLATRRAVPAVRRQPDGRALVGGSPGSRARLTLSPAAPPLAPAGSCVGRSFGWSRPTAASISPSGLAGSARSISRSTSDQISGSVSSSSPSDHLGPAHDDEGHGPQDGDGAELGQRSRPVADRGRVTSPPRWRGCRPGTAVGGRRSRRPRGSSAQWTGRSGSRPRARAERCRVPGRSREHRRPEDESRQQDDELEHHAGRCGRRGARLTAPVVRVPTATTVTKTMAGTGRTATRSTASTGAGRVSACEKGRGVPVTSSGGTASMRRRRWTTRASSDQWAARSPSGQVTASRRASVPRVKQRNWRWLARRPSARVART